MATKYLCPEALDGGLDYISANATKLLLVSGYTLLDPYATVVAAKLAEVTMASGDYAKSGADGAARVLTTTAKSATATAAASGTPDLHFVFTNGSNKVIWVTYETSNPAAVAIGDPIDFPALTRTSGQPT